MFVFKVLLMVVEFFVCFLFLGFVVEWCMFVVLVYVWNLLVIKEVVGFGYIDGLFVMFLLVVVFVLECGLMFVSGVFVVLVMVVKILVVLFVGVLFVFVWFCFGMKVVFYFVVVFVVLIVVVFVFFVDDLIVIFDVLVVFVCEWMFNFGFWFFV